jgi:hypothetical protein
VLAIDSSVLARACCLSVRKHEILLKKSADQEVDSRNCPGLQRVEVENRDVTRLPVAREAPAELGRQGNPVHSRRIGYVADRGSRLSIEHHDVVSTRDKDAMRRNVVNQVVPGSRAANVYFFQ